MNNKMNLTEQQLFYLYMFIVLILLLIIFNQSVYEGMCVCPKGGIPDPVVANRQQLQRDVVNCQYPDHFHGVL